MATQNAPKCKCDVLFYTWGFEKERKKLRERGTETNKQTKRERKKDRARHGV